mmetsp:Transcript_955/g.4067  ORF Transcript_955/g.4067 Transcript_955/m.4067 type:complete len:152 (+) Transcript_955:706-1161(+)
MPSPIRRLAAAPAGWRLHRRLAGGALAGASVDPLPSSSFDRSVAEDGASSPPLPRGGLFLNPPPFLNAGLPRPPPASPLPGPPVPDSDDDVGDSPPTLHLDRTVEASPSYLRMSVIPGPSFRHPGGVTIATHSDRSSSGVSALLSRSGGSL